MNAEKSYKQILKSTSITGAAAAFVMVFGFIRTKIAAVLLGTAGVGLLASLTAIQNVVVTFSGLGLGGSAVREIAAANNNREIIGESLATLRRLSWITGLIGMFVIIVSSSHISRLTFGNDEYKFDVAGVGLVVLASNLSAIYLALLQGMRRVREMALANVYAILIGTILTVALYFVLGLHGIVPGIIVTSAAQLFFAKHYAKKLGVLSLSETWVQTYRRGLGMFGLGFVLMWSSLLVSVASYIIVYMINLLYDVHGVGIYSAAFVLSGALVNFVLNAMGTDYYPRLTVASANNADMCSLVNQQIEIGLLITMSALLGGMVFSPFLVEGFYSENFMAAVPLLQWFILGCLGRVISWPMGFVILAMGKGRWFLITETSFNVVHTLLVGFCLWVFGIEGVAVAYCAAYFFYTFAVYLYCKNSIGFIWESSCLYLIAVAIALLTSSLIISRTATLPITMLFGSVFLAISCVLCFRNLLKRLGSESQFFLRLEKIKILRILINNLHPLR